jgi:tRNA threonylcarbamoyladenosine biosynthesis protein TsaE
MLQYKTHSAEETIAAGLAFGSQIPDNAVICFFGDLGAGKTTFIKGLAAGVTQCSSEAVNSPTYVYLNVYTGNRILYHFDLYRLKNSQEFIDMGFDDFFHAGGVCCIEWSEKIKDIIPKGCMYVEIAHSGPEERAIKIWSDPPC